MMHHHCTWGHKAGRWSWRCGGRSTRVHRLHTHTRTTGKTLQRQQRTALDSGCGRQERSDEGYCDTYILRSYLEQSRAHNKRQSSESPQSHPRMYYYYCCCYTRTTTVVVVVYVLQEEDTHYSVIRNKSACICTYTYTRYERSKRMIRCQQPSRMIRSEWVLRVHLHLICRKQARCTPLGAVTVAGGSPSVASARFSGCQKGSAGKKVGRTLDRW